jgi:hypothetical protein
MYLSNNKACRGHHTSLKSCMLRIPGSVNAKDEKNLKEVRIIQEWGGKRSDYRLLLGVFYAHLAAKKAEAEKEAAKFRASGNSNNYNRSNNGDDAIIVPWVEELLRTPLEDKRKDLIFWVLAPYLVTVSKLDDAQAFREIGAWLAKCHELRRLQPSPADFKNRINCSLKAAREKARRPLGLQKFEARYPDISKKLYEKRSVY